MSRARLLSQYLAAPRPAGWCWLTANCCHFAAGWTLLVTGRDPMVGLRCTVDARAALRLVAELGGMAAAWSRQLESEPIPVATARLGDVVLLPLAGPRSPSGVGAAIGICTGRDAVFVDEMQHLVRVSVSDASFAWRLP